MLIWAKIIQNILLCNFAASILYYYISTLLHALHACFRETITPPYTEKMTLAFVIRKGIKFVCDCPPKSLKLWNPKKLKGTLRNLL